MQIIKFAISINKKYKKEQECKLCSETILHPKHILTCQNIPQDISHTIRHIQRLTCKDIYAITLQPYSVTQKTILKTVAEKLEKISKWYFQTLKSWKEQLLLILTKIHKLTWIISFKLYVLYVLLFSSSSYSSISSNAFLKPSFSNKFLWVNYSSDRSSLLEKPLLYL